MKTALIALSLVLSGLVHGAGFTLTQKRFTLSYGRQGNSQKLTFKGQILMEGGEKETTLLSVLRNRVEPGLNTTIVLDVFGGDLAVVNKVFAELRGKCHDRGHQSCRIRTEVEMFRHCASACVPLFMVGDDRVAAERSSWGFHQASTAVVPVIIPFMAEYVLKQKGVSPAWLQQRKAMFRTLKMTWLSPADLQGSSIVTRIIPHPK